MAWWEDAIAQIEREHGGSVEPEDIATLQGKHEEDRAAYLQALAEKQDRREASTSHRAGDSQGPGGTGQNPLYGDDPRLEPGYGVSDGTYRGAPLQSARTPMSASSYGALMPGWTGFGAEPEPFGETYAPLARPSYLQGEYTPGQWTEQFVAPGKPSVLQTPFALPEKPSVLRTPYALPTQAELEASPGYLSARDAMQRGMERSAAAKGSVLSGGFVGRALPRALGEYAGTAYGNLVGQTLGARQQQYGEYTGDVNQALGARQQQFGEYSGDVSRAFDEYRQRYGQFADREGLRLGARNVNEAAFQGDQASNLTGYKTRYGQYLDANALKRQAETDLWSRNRDLSDLSLRAAALARP